MISPEVCKPRSDPEKAVAMLPRISVLFITYNRLVTLKPTVEAFLANTDYPRDRLELIVCDDSSPRAVQDEILTMPFDSFCLAKARGGLGRNQNNGLRRATGDYILQLQDDWVCQGPSHYLRDAVEIMSRRPELGMLFFHKNPMPLVVRETIAIDGGVLRIFENIPGDRRQQAYSDRPHLKSREFVQALGLYLESRKMWECELEFTDRVNGQNRFFIGQSSAHERLFSDIGADHSHNLSSRKVKLAKKISSYPGGAAALKAYFQIKHLIKTHRRAT
ncbi:hypothetical protein GGD83_004106 [Rhodoblastus sphagnicola]|uniref:glycosyltransferase n=1 Tax=Rhodoblastus sphagnicola TaxID=333368 RepID=UPI001305061D|nr:glycosyltransferase family 2 protein [Rhodoblastus sphagnicola]MBB4200277.1 hypothetical protein [Rhodoblastus sphagnicola]